MNYDALTAWGTIGGAVATFLAVLVALFFEPWRRWRAAPRLWLTWRKRDSSEVRRGNRITYVRLFIQNVGKEAAQRVQVTVGDVCKLADDGSLKLVPGFLPTALVWTHSSSTVCEYLPGRSSRLCDLGEFHASDRPDTSLAHHGPTYFRCATHIEPESKYNYLKQGSYVARLVTSALNARAASQVVQLSVGKHILLGEEPLAEFSMLIASADLRARYRRLLSGQERSA